MDMFCRDFVSRLKNALNLKYVYQDFLTEGVSNRNGLSCEFFPI